MKYKRLLTKEELIENFGWDEYLVLFLMLLISVLMKHFRINFSCLLNIARVASTICDNFAPTDSFYFIVRKTLKIMVS